MDIRIEFERQRQQQDSSGPRRVRYPAALRRKATAYSAERRKQGASMREVARELGVTKSALFRWQTEGQQPSAGQPTLRPMQVIATPPREGAGLVLRGPRGIVVEGLSIDALAELLKKVGA